MSTVVIDTTTRDKLLAAGSEAELRDESGALIGRFVRTDRPTPPAGYEIVGDWPSEDELLRREREEQSYTPEQVMERLRGLRDAR